MGADPQPPSERQLGRQMEPAARHHKNIITAGLRRGLPLPLEHRLSLAGRRWHSSHT
jgi:hypothetical protein